VIMMPDDGSWDDDSWGGDIDDAVDDNNEEE
jgi:hypothetical protein